MNSACAYSMYCKKEKYTPKIHVMVNPFLAFLKLLFSKEWCAQVIEAPDEIRIIVFNKGTLIGLKLTTDTGGHVCPSSILGLKEKWKNLQKKEEKNIISDVMNKIIPNFKPLITSL